MAWNFGVKSSGGLYDNLVPFKEVDALTKTRILNAFRNSSTRIAIADSVRYWVESQSADVQYLDSFYSGATVPVNNITINGVMWCGYFKAMLYNDNDDPTGYSIAPLARGGGGYGLSVSIIRDSDNARMAELGGVTYSGNLKGQYFLFTDNNDVYIGCVAYDDSDTQYTRDLKFACTNVTRVGNHYDYRQYGKKVETEMMSDEFGKPSEEGGYTGGTFDDSSDTIAIPTMPSIGVTSAGFVNVYNPSVNALQGFGAELFPDLTFSSSSHISGSSSVADAIEAAANALVDLGNQIPNIVNMYINSNLINYVIDCHILPVAPTIGAAANIKVGFKQFTASAPIVTSDYVDFDCGTLNVGEYYANFIDYAPYTRARLFLPFVGFVDLQPEFFQSGSVNIVYRFNIIDGSFMCYVLSTSSKSKLTNSVIMQFGGNACVHIPITGLNYSSMVSGVVGGAASMVASQAGVSGLNQRAGSAITSAITSAVDVAQSKPPVQASNGYNATTSFLSVRTPYLLIERSVSNFSIAYTEEKGVPSNITSDFASLTGFTQATAVHLDGIRATEEEKAEIAALLAQGVIL